MNILFIGPYRGQDGWGHAAQNYIRALATLNHNLTIRPIFLGRNICEIPEDLLEYEFETYDHYDICIQNVLPHYLNYDKRVGKNIALVHTETSHLEYTSWISRINLVDECWVASPITKQNLLDSGVTIPIQVIPIPIDITIFEKEYEPLNISQLKNGFTFYSIGEFITRKNFAALIQAFHLAFSPSASVNLLLKLNHNSISKLILEQRIQQLCTQLKKTMRIYLNPNQYKQEIIVTDYLQSEELYRLYNTCNCFISSSMGESYNQPCIMAMGFGHPILVTQNTGPEFLITEDKPVGWTINSHKIQALDNSPPIADLYTSREQWYNIDVHDLSNKMRDIWMSKNKYQLFSKNGKEKIKEFSYNKIGQLISKYL